MHMIEEAHDRLEGFWWIFPSITPSAATMEDSPLAYNAKTELKLHYEWVLIKGFSFIEGLIESLIEARVNDWLNLWIKRIDRLGPTLD